MPSIKLFKQGFSSGELSPELFGQIDLGKYQAGVSTAKNMITLPQGVAKSRAGFQFVREVKTSTKKTRLIPFSFSSSQTFAIEMGEFYFRFHTQSQTLGPGTPAAYNGATAYVIGNLVSSGGINYYCIANTTGNAPPNATYWYAMPAGIYEIPHPYTEADLLSVKYETSGDIVTLVHAGYAPRELKRFGNTQWILSVIAFASTTLAPTGCAVVATYPTAGTTKKHQYGVTALNSLGFEESLLSNVPAAVNNDLTITGNFNTITWNSVTGASRYNVYKYANGTYGFIGQTAVLSFVDDNIIADLTQTVPIQEAFFGVAGSYPSTVAYYEQRRIFAASNDAPQNVWTTQSASDYNMAYSIPSRSSDAIRFKIAANRANAIRHLISVLDLLALTASTEYRIFSGGDTALSASSITIKAQAQNGVSEVRPAVVNNVLLYEQAQGGHVREMILQPYSNGGYISSDISLLAPHLFDNFHLIDLAFSRAPYPVLWCTSSSGKLLGLTYVNEQKIVAWHKHETEGGVFESCCTVTELDEDRLYVIVKRIINGVTKRYVEVLHSRLFTDKSDAFFVDSGLTYSGAAVDTITGLEHLEGKIVSVLGDGIVMQQRTVVSGSITLEAKVSKAQIGLPINAQLRTLPIYFQDPSFGQGRIKSINKVWVRVDQTGIFKAGPDENRLTPIMPLESSAAGTGLAPSLMSGELLLTIAANWNQDGRVLLQQDLPLPLSVVSLTTEVSLGG